jgi:hypothetical protein
MAISAHPVRKTHLVVFPSLAGMVNVIRRVMRIASLVREIVARATHVWRRICLDVEDVLVKPVSAKLILSVVMWRGMSVVFRSVSANVRRLVALKAEGAK